MFKYLLTTLGICVATLCVHAQAFDTLSTDLFYPTLRYEKSQLNVTFTLNYGEYVYADGFAIKATQGSTLKPIAPLPEPRMHDGTLSYSGTVTFSYDATEGTTFSVGYSGCDLTACYIPVAYSFQIKDGAVISSDATAAQSVDVVEEAPKAFAWVPEDMTLRLRSSDMDPPTFISFLNNDIELGFFEDPVAYVKANGLWLALILVFLGGILLNLTPCVLPMIPINLAIIGAGATQGSRMTGAMRGGVYGLGIALAYGSLGLLAVLTGSAFGTIQSSPWFSLSIAVIFVVLGLALFDVLFIDFARFSSGGANKRGKGLGAAFVAGAVSAVLAGACVAPVLIAVLLLTADYYAAGYTIALLLPFLLGLGMASPWPIAGAGLSFLPKPGMWMVRVKYLFGVMVLVFAAYYGYLAFVGFRPVTIDTSADTPLLLAGDTDAWQAILDRARQENKPLLVDFWATWCKSCAEMERTTLQDADVKTAIEEGFIFVKVQCEVLSDPATAAHIQALGIKGLPAYAVITPVDNP